MCFSLAIGLSDDFATQKRSLWHFSHCNQQLLGCAIKAGPAYPPEWSIQDPPQTVCTNELRAQIPLGPSKAAGGHKISQRWDQALAIKNQLVLAGAVSPNICWPYKTKW